MQANSLRWTRIAEWDLSQTEQVLFTADGREVQYKVTRAGTADKPTWRVYTRLPDGLEACRAVSVRLREAKAHAVRLETTGGGTAPLG